VTQSKKPEPCAAVVLPLQVFLNMQDRLLAQRGKSAWSKDYYMPAPCDGLVAVGEATICSPHDQAQHCA
jgi:hypothetical protein